MNLVESQKASAPIRAKLYKLKAEGWIEEHVPASQWSLDGGHCRGGTSSAIKKREWKACLTRARRDTRSERDDSKHGTRKCQVTDFFVRTKQTSQICTHRRAVSTMSPMRKQTSRQHNRRSGGTQRSILNQVILCEGVRADSLTACVWIILIRRTHVHTRSVDQEKNINK